MSPDCAHCPFAQDGKPRHAMVQAQTCANPRGVLVGEGPGNSEVTTGIPFTGATGTQLDEALERTGIPRARLVVGNAMACVPPPKMKTDANLRDATAACRPWFLEWYEPYIKLPTLAMGKWAGAAVNNGKPIPVKTGRGFIRDNLLVTWHPTYAFFYNQWVAGEFLNDLARFKRMIEGQVVAPPKIVIRPSRIDLYALERDAKRFAKQIHALTDKLGQHPYVMAMACDIETRPREGRPDYEGKDPTRAVMKTISFGTPMLSMAHWWGNGKPYVESMMVAWLANPSILKILHNGHFFDNRIMRRMGLRVTNTCDTRDIRRAVSATSALALRFLTSVATDYTPWKEVGDDK